ncbi:MAG: tyrosine-type recombinase/integrase [Bacilli bacterium]|nr:tyrosine-type recombinase/integrase [bacterium]MDY2697584.1 tyrosine-type recombinase/integrase [Bacilli bacterium]
MAVYNEKDKNKWTKDERHWYFICYYTNIQGNKKQYKSKMFFSKKEAEKEELLFITKRDNPSLVKFDVVSLDYFKYMYSSRKESTIYSYEYAFKKNIEPYFSGFYINNINIQLINHWKAETRKKGYKLAYLNKLYVILKEIFDYAIRNYNLESNVVQLSGRFEHVNDEVVSDEDKLRYITHDDFNKFISCIEDITWKTFFIFLYYTGMRKGEIQALTWNDINFNSNEVIVNKTLSVKTRELYKITSTKNYINRKIKISKTLRDQLLLYKDYCKQYSDFKESWFVFGCTRFMPQTTIDNKKHYYFKLSGVKEITIHEFRHSHVSLLINEYVKSGQTDTTKFFLMLSNRMGHSIKVMQETYMHLFPTIQNEIVDLLDNL